MSKMWERGAGSKKLPLSTSDERFRVSYGERDARFKEPETLPCGDGISDL